MTIFETTVWACKKCGRCGGAEQCACGGTRAQLAESDALNRFAIANEPSVGWRDRDDLVKAWRESEDR